MRTRPINPPTAGTAAKTGRRRQHVRRRDLRHLFPRDIHEIAVTLAAPCVLQGRIRSEIQATKDLEQLILEIIGSDKHRPRPGGGELAIPGQQPSALGPSPLGKPAVFRPGLEENRVEAEETEPPSQRTQHRVTQKFRAARSISLAFIHLSTA